MGLWLSASERGTLDDLAAITGLCRGDILRFGLSWANHSIRTSWGLIDAYTEGEKRRWRAKVRKRTQKELGSSDSEGDAGKS